MARMRISSLTRLSASGWRLYFSDLNKVGKLILFERTCCMTHLAVAAAASAFNHTLEPLDAKLSKYVNGAPIRIVSCSLITGHLLC